MKAGSYLCCSLLHAWSLEKCLAHSRSSKNICRVRTNEWARSDSKEAMSDSKVGAGLTSGRTRLQVDFYYHSLMGGNQRVSLFHLASPFELLSSPVRCESHERRWSRATTHLVQPYGLRRRVDVWAEGPTDRLPGEVSPGGDLLGHWFSVAFSRPLTGVTCATHLKWAPSRGFWSPKWAANLGSGSPWPCELLSLQTTTQQAVTPAQGEVLGRVKMGRQDSCPQEAVTKQQDKDNIHTGQCVFKKMNWRDRHWDVHSDRWLFFFFCLPTYYNVNMHYLCYIKKI